MRTARSASRTWRASSSAVEYTATASTPSLCSDYARRRRPLPTDLRAKREPSPVESAQHFQPALDGIKGAACKRFELEQDLTELDGLRVLDADRADDALEIGLHLVHELHRLEDAERLPRTDDVPDLDERWRTRFRRAVEGADHRRLDAVVAVRRPHRGSGGHVWERERRVGDWRSIGARAHGDAHAVLFDRDLSDAGLLDDADDLADPFGAGLVDGGELVAFPGRAAADTEQEPFRVLAEETEQEELLLACGHALRLRAHLAQSRRDVLFALRVRRQLDGAHEGRVDRARRHAEAAGHERAQLVDDRQVAARREDVQERLRREHAADRRRQWRPADLRANAIQLLED